jgi:hypothetical protein
MRFTQKTRRSALLLLAVSAFALSAAGATDEERATARSLANHGITAFKEKRYPDAVDMFQRAESLVHSPVHLLYLGRSLVATGKLVRAQEAYLKATREPITGSSPPAFSKAVDEANTELDALRPRLAQLTVTISGLTTAEKAEVQIDGEPISSVMVGVPVPMDPGQHRVEAKASRHLPAWRKISLAEGQAEKVALKLEDDPNAPPLVDPEVKTEQTEGTTAAGAGASGTATAASHEPNQGFLYSSIGALAIGLAGVGLGTYYIVKAQDPASEADRLYSKCPITSDGNSQETRSCDKPSAARIDELDSRTGSYRVRSLASYVVGGVGLLLGTTLIILYGNSGSTSSASTAPGLHIQPWIGVRSVGLSGTF